VILIDKWEAESWEEGASIIIISRLLRRWDINILFSFKLYYNYNIVGQ